MSTVYTYGVKVAKRWENNIPVNAGVDWFSSDIEVIDTTTNFPVKHTIQMMIPDSSKVSLYVTTDSIEKIYTTNAGVALTAGAGYQFYLILWPGDSYNIRHESGSQDVSCKIFETDNLDI